MPALARVTDVTSLGGAIVGPGNSTVLVGGMPTVVIGDKHVYGAPSLVSTFVVGNSSVLIGGKPVICVGCVCSNGSTPILGFPSVQIG